jgi:hypothetical protein
MSNPLKYSDFAKAIQCARGSITMAVKSGTLIPVEGKKEIDPDNPVNMAWIAKQEAKGNKKFDINLIYDAGSPAASAEIPANEKPGEKNLRTSVSASDLVKVDLKVKLANFKKTENENRLSELKIQKMEGELIPTDAASNIFLYAIESYKTSFLQGVKSISNIFSQRLGADHNQYVEIQKQLSESIVSITETAKANVLEGLEAAVLEYKEVRGRGEKR